MISMLSAASLLPALTGGSAAAATVLLSAIWQGTVLVAAVALCMRFMPRLSAAARSAIWMNVFLLLVLLHVAPISSTHSAAASPSAGSPVQLDLRWSIGIACLWAVFSLWRGIELILGAASLRRVARAAVPVAPTPELLDLLETPRSRRIALCVSAEVERPSVFGFFRPRILLPPGLIESLTPAELRQVILHETGHVRRGDDWSNLLQKLALVFFPLNPALLWVERRLCAERELACDDRVLRASSERKSYALCLTRLAEYAILRRSLSLVLGAFERKPELVKRVHRILDRPANALSGKPAFALSGVLVAGALLCAVALGRSPQLISFEPHVSPETQAQVTAPAPVVSGPAAPQFIKAEMTQSKRAPKPAARPSLSQLPNVGPGAPEFTAKSEAREQIRPEPLQPYAPILTAAKQAQNPPAPVRQDWVVLTTWSSTAEPAQLVIAVDRDTRPRYAAVPLADGWLIVQI